MLVFLRETSYLYLKIEKYKNKKNRKTLERFGIRAVGGYTPIRTYFFLILVFSRVSMIHLPYCEILFPLNHFHNSL